MAKRAKLSESDLKAIVQVEISNCEGAGTSELTKQRTENLEYYNAGPLGTEVKDRSQVVSPDVRDAVEWVMPTLMRIFTSGENVCQFEPEEQGDIESAKQATEYVNFIWQRDNPGFLNFYTWFKDALISKNGVIKVSYANKDKSKRERYSGLDEETYALLVNDPQVVVSEHSETQTQTIVPSPEPGAPPQLMPVTTHDVVLTRTEKSGRVVVEPMPPEEFLISRDARTIEDARYVGHKRLRTISDLIAEGFDRDKVEGLASDESTSSDAEALARDTVDESLINGGASTMNTAMRSVWVYEGYLKVDVDGDGIAEMRQITSAGPGYETLKDEAWDADRPFVNLTPIIIPHRFVGLALADLAKVWQLLRSTVLRQYLDNLYLSNNQREEVLEANIVQPDEALSHKPGQKIRIKNGPAIFPIQVPQIGSAALEGMNYLDQLKENSTGVSARTQGLGSNKLHDTAAGEQMLMTAAMGKIELIARVFAETGVKEAFRKILRLVTMYQDKPRTVRLTGKDFVPIDPRSWNADMDMAVSVGLGTGDKAQQMQAAMTISELQKTLFPLGMVSPENAMATAEMVVNAAGQKGVERFFTAKDPNAPPAPDPAQAEAQAKTQADMAKFQAEGQMKAQQMQADAQMKAQQMQMDAQFKTQQAQADAAMSQQRLQAEFELKRYQTDQELALKREQLSSELDLKRQQLVAELQLKREMGIYQASQSEVVTSDVRLGGDAG